MIHICKVCAILDNDLKLKDCFYCSLCKSWICHNDKYRIDRRIRAMRISKLHLGIVLLSVLFLNMIPAENIPHQAVVKWTKPTGQFDGFNVYRRYDSCNCNSFIYLKHVDIVYRYVDKALIGRDMVSYKVRTTLNGNESKDSPVAMTIVPY